MAHGGGSCSIQGTSPEAGQGQGHGAARTVDVAAGAARQGRPGELGPGGISLQPAGDRRRWARLYRGGDRATGGTVAWERALPFGPQVGGPQRRRRHHVPRGRLCWTIVQPLLPQQIPPVLT